MKNNGVVIENVMNLVKAVDENRELGNVTFKGKSQWKGGTQAEVTVSELTAGGNNIARPDRNFKLLVDEPAELGGKDEAPNPVEYLAAGLCGCITAGMATNGALFETEFEKIDIDVDVNFNVCGVFGLDDAAPNGALDINLTIRAKGPSEKWKIEKVKEVIDGKSPVKGTLELPLKVHSTLIVED